MKYEWSWKVTRTQLVSQKASRKSEGDITYFSGATSHVSTRFFLFYLYASTYLFLDFNIVRMLVHDHKLAFENNNMRKS